MMGTNYYWESEPGPPCEHCPHKEEHVPSRIHIGKSSAGWSFSWHGYKDVGLTSVRRWVKFLVTEKGRIVDEYDQEEPLTKFLYGALRYGSMENGTKFLVHAEEHGEPGLCEVDEDGYSISFYEFS